MIKLPKYIIEWYGSARGYKHSKRSELRTAMSELNELFSGSFWSPAYKEISHIRELLKIIKEKQSVKNWGK